MRVTRYTPLLALLCFWFVFPSACKPKTANVKDDLLQYLEKARIWTTTEEQITNAITTVRRDQFVHDDLVVETLKPAVTVAREYVQELERYQPQTPPLVNVHHEYIEAWRAHYFSLATLIDAVEKKDYIQLAKANNDLLEAQRSVSDALADLARLFRQAGIQEEPFPEQQAPSSPAKNFEITPSTPS